MARDTFGREHRITEYRYRDNNEFLTRWTSSNVIRIFHGTSGTNGTKARTGKGINRTTEKKIINFCCSVHVRLKVSFVAGSSGKSVISFHAVLFKKKRSIISFLCKNNHSATDDVRVLYVDIVGSRMLALFALFSVPVGISKTLAYFVITA